MKIPSQYAPPLFALVLSGMASFLVSGISTLRAVGMVDGIGALWMSAWIPSWCVAFPVIFLMAPVVRKFVAAVTRDA